MIDRVGVVVWLDPDEKLRIEVFSEAHEAINFAIDTAERGIYPAVVSCPIRYPETEGAQASLQSGCKRVYCECDIQGNKTI